MSAAQGWGLCTRMCLTFMWLNEKGEMVVDMFTPDHITGQNAGQASCSPSPNAPQRPGLT